MGEATGVLKIITPTGTDTFSWNGIPHERAAARAEFEARMKSGQFLSTVTDSPGHRSQVKSFDEVEEIEKRRGTVEVIMSPALVGG